MSASRYNVIRFLFGRRYQARPEAQTIRPSAASSAARSRGIVRCLRRGRAVRRLVTRQYQKHTYIYIHTNIHAQNVSRETLFPKCPAMKNLLPSRQLPDRPRNLRQLGINGAALQPQSMIDGRITADHSSSRNIMRNAALRDSDRSVSNLDVPRDADLSG